MRNQANNKLPPDLLHLISVTTLLLNARHVFSDTF